MYSVVVMAALTTGGAAPDMFMRGHGCTGCTGCSGTACYGTTCYGSSTSRGYTCYGSSTGCSGYASCSGCTGCTGCTGTYYGCTGCQGAYNGCYGTSCYGAYYGGCYGGAPRTGCYGTSCYGAYYGGCYGGCWGVGTSWTVPGYSTYTPVMPPADPKLMEKTPAKPEGTSMAPNRARLVVEVPADAQLFIDDQPMKTTSDRRLFNTPDLEPGQTYYYLIRAEVQRDGKPVTETKRVLVRAGEVIPVTFGTMDAVSTAKAR